jgi:hypothetical protein
MSVQKKYGLTIKLLESVTVVGPGSGKPGHPNTIYQSILTGTGGALHAVIHLESTEEDEADAIDADAHWIWFATVTHDVAAWESVANDDAGSFAWGPGLKRVRAKVVELTGAGAAVTLLAGV